MTIFKQTIKHCLRRFGHLIRPYDYLQKYTFAHHVLSVFERFRIDCVFDVGANVGLYRNFLRTEVGYRGLILSFEPVEKNVATLKRLSARDSRWIIHGCALGNESSRKAINVMRSDLFTSFLKPDAKTVSEFNELNQVSYQETVSICRLADIYDQLAAQFSFRSSFLKIDTQGYDLEVLKGAGEVLDRFKAVQTEASVIPLYETMPDFLEIHRALISRNFALSAFNPVVIDSQLRLVEFDWIFVNERFKQ